VASVAGHGSPHAEGICPKLTLGNEQRPEVG